MLTVAMLCFSLACKQNRTKFAENAVTKSMLYTCSMHPQVMRDVPGSCPVCYMELTLLNLPNDEDGIDNNLVRDAGSVNEKIVSTAATIKPDAGQRSFSIPVQGLVTYDLRNSTGISSRVAGRIEKLYIKYNNQPISKGQLIMQIYSPDLAVAQRELLFIYQSDKQDGLIAKAKQKLLLLGMSATQINKLLITGKINYSIPVYSYNSGYIVDDNLTAKQPENNYTSGPAASIGMNAMADNVTTLNPAINPTSSPIFLREGQYVNAGQTLFRLYNNRTLVVSLSLPPVLATSVKRGEPIVLHSVSDSQIIYRGIVGLIQPTINQGNTYTIAKVYLPPGELQVGQLMVANINIVRRGYWIPESAVMDLGNRAIVFKKENKAFLPKTILKKFSANGLVLVNDSLANWEIARHAGYLADSESFIPSTDKQKQ